MKFSLVNGVRSEAYPKLKGKCPACGNETISKCGDIVIHHWAHQNSKECDRWWENETKWHRDWKNLYPQDWQEVTHFGLSGEIHRADVTNSYGWVLEFQHSSLSQIEVKERSDFYKKIIWVVDGLKIKNTLEQFEKCLVQGNYFSRNPSTCFLDRFIPSIVRRWLEVDELVLIDVGNSSTLYLIQKAIGGVYLIEVPKKFFIKASLGIDSDDLNIFKNQISLHRDNLNNLKKVPPRGFLAPIPHFIFNLDGTIHVVK